MRATTLSAALFATVAALLAVTAAPADSDLFWHLASGDWMLDHGRLLDHDVYSYTRTGAPYSVGQWLGQIALALAFRWAAWPGVDVLRALLVGVATFAFARIVLRVQPHVGWAALPILGTILVSRMVWGDRPQLFTLALFAIVVDLLMAARLEGRTRRLAIVPAIFLVWANLHNAFVIGEVALAVFTIEVFLEGSRAQRRAFGLTLLASVVLALLNPAGAGAFARAAAYGALLANWIVEDRPLDMLSGAGLVLGSLLIVSLGAALARGRDGIAARLGAPLLWPGLIGPFSVLAIAIQRETPYACMLVAPFAAAMVPDALGRARTVAPSVPRAAGAIVSAALLAAAAALAITSAPREPDLRAYPAGALTTLAALHGNVLNEYDWGGYLIRFAPEHPTFIDGRGEALFVPDVLNDFGRMVQVRTGYRELLKQWDIRIALLRPDRALAGALREDGWLVRAEDGGRWVLLERP
ncbi:MAG TPA: hypothetical protein VGQ86_01790 [Candidatus Limnocylindria bacterium]|nr:hypothetical protein [Candidatus Limnocylindria bacterium]